MNTRKEKNKKLAIDFDEVLSETNRGFLHFLKGKGRTDFAFEDLTEHNWEEISGFELSKDEILHLWDEYILLEEDVSPVAGSIEMLESLKDEYSLFIVTARQEKLKEQTRKWVERYFGGIIDSIVFANMYADNYIKKSEICKNLGIGCMIEDNIDTALEIAESGMDVYLIEKPWNRFRQEKHENMKKVKSWFEISEHLSLSNRLAGEL